MTTATAKLNTALITMASHGSRPRCADPVDHALWTSEDPAERAVPPPGASAAGCSPSTTKQREARKEKWGIWGGRDRSNRPGRKAA